MRWIPLFLFFVSVVGAFAVPVTVNTADDSDELERNDADYAEWIYGPQELFDYLAYGNQVKANQSNIKADKV